MGLYNKTLGEAGKQRRTDKRRERWKIREELYAYRPTYEERLKWGDLRPHSFEALESRLNIFGRDMNLLEHPEQMATAARLGNSFLRGVQLRAPIDYTGDAQTLMDIGEAHLQSVAQYCGARVVTHEFGIYDTSQLVSVRTKGSYLLPRDYILTAIVESLKDPQPPTAEQIIRINDGIHEYQATHENYHLTDLNYGQFIVGHTVMNSEVQLYLADIDMLFA